MEFFGDSKDYIMHDGRKEDFAWESSVKLTLVGSEDLGMYLEEREREGRKRKWQEGKMRREELEEKEQRKMPPKKIMANLDMGGSGTSSSSSHLSPGWQVNDLDLDLPGELSMNEALLSLPSLAVFKQEAPSPTGNVLSPPRRSWPARRTDDRQITNMVVDNREPMDEGCQQHTGVMNTQSNSPESMQCQSMPVIMPMNGYHSPTQENKNAGLLMCSPVSSLDGFLHSPRPDSCFKDDNRFQYVLAAATSIATKQNEETLTYLNQGQPYEIKLKKLGDLAHYKGKILKSIIKICFHERRLQYMEREQIAQWHNERPGERILEVDVPLSYGVSRVEQPAVLNELHVHWDPTKDVGVYVKVNCISTEFTAKKHGGEKGVPFRIQVETTYEDRRLHTAACQIKVFKLKGADRKHKQDRERVLRRPRSELERYQPGCDATVLTTLSNDALMPPPRKVPQVTPQRPKSIVQDKIKQSPPKANNKSEPIQRSRKAASPVRNTVPQKNTKSITPNINTQKVETETPKENVISESENPATRVRELYDKIQKQQLVQMASLVEKQKKEQMLLQQVFEEQNNLLFTQLKTICPKSPIDVKEAWVDQNKEDGSHGPVSLSQLINQKLPDHTHNSPNLSTLTETKNYINYCDNILKKSRDVKGSIKNPDIKPGVKSNLPHQVERPRTYSPTRKNTPTSRKLTYDNSASSDRDKDQLTDRTNDTMADILNVTFPSDYSDECPPYSHNNVINRSETSPSAMVASCRSTDRAIRSMEQTIQNSINSMGGRSKPNQSRAPTPRERAAATRIVSFAKGYLVRRLMSTERVQATVQTIKDALLCALQLHQEREGIRGADVDLHRRLIQQITAACYSLNDTFISSTPSERCALIAADRARRRSLAARIPTPTHRHKHTDIMSQSHSGAFPPRVKRQPPSLMTQSNYETFSSDKCVRRYMPSPLRRPWR